MTYSLIWHPQAFKVLKKLQQSMIDRVSSKFDEVILDPFRYLEHYEGSNLYKIRSGDYRALVEINIPEKIILVKVFDHRGKVYKK